MFRKSTKIHRYGVGDAVACSSLVLVVCLCLFSFAQPARAAIVVTGDVDPADPATWTSGTDGYIGKDSTGTLDITSDSDVVARAGYIGYNSGSTGEVTVEGAGSTWTNSAELDIGDSGNGTLNITNGGAVSNFDGTIGAELDSTGTVNVDGAGSMWTNNSSLLVGHDGIGTLNISDGGTVSNAWSGYIGYNSDSTGEVTVDGLDSTWASSIHLYVGFSGSGTLNITGNGVVTVEKETWVAHDDGSSGTIHFDSGTLTTGDLLCASDSLTGTGTINTHGLVRDVDLVFDATHGLSQTFNINDNPGQNITVNLDVASSVYMGAGYSGVGTMSISDGIAVESLTGYIGYKSGSTGEVTVDGTGSTWTNSDSLTIGNSGSGTLNITGGGAVSNSVGYVGLESGSSGTVTVSGASSTWNNSSDIAVGMYGTGVLNINNGGAVSNSYGYVGFESDSSGTVTVSGADSTWTNRDDLYVGLYGTGELSINNGGTVSNSEGYVGVESGSMGTVTVTGAGSTWTNSSNFIVGLGGTGVLNITDGGIVSNTKGYISYGSSSTGTVTVSGAGSTWNISSDLYMGYELGSTGGELNILDGGTVNNSKSYIGCQWGSAGTVNVSGVGSTWNNSSHLYLGYGSRNNSELNITNGATVSNANGYVGYNPAHETGRSTVIVSGAGSTWTNSGSLQVGVYAGDGVLNITDGATVNSYTGHIAHYSGSKGSVTVSGEGSTWTNSSILNIASDYHAIGELNITEGGTVSNLSCTIGSWSEATGTVTVSGAGSTWTNNGDLTLGSVSTGELNITGGGFVDVGDTTWVARGAGSSGTIYFDNGTLTTGSLATDFGHLTGTGTINTNGLILDGVDLVFDATHGSQQTIALNDQNQNIVINLDQNSSGNLGAGYTDSGTLTIREGVTVESKHGYIGYQSGSTGEVTVDGVGSTWTNSEDLVVGHYGAGDLNVINGGTVNNVAGYIANYTGSKGTVTVSGAGSTWTNSSKLDVGGNGTLNITDGGTVNNSYSKVSGRSTVTVSGPGSTWTNSGSLKLGAFGSWSKLNITDGGSVSSSYSYIDNRSTVTVSGSGSTWTNRGGYLYVGSFGSGTMNITGGGVVSNSRGYISSSSNSTGEVTVDGAGSTWTNSEDLRVGYKGSGVLNITNGGVVSNRYEGYIGFESGSTGEVTVDGASSTWNSRDLRVGYSGSGTLNITDGGLVSVAGGLTIDDDADGDSFINMATGGMLALNGDADDSLVDFLGLIDGTDAIRYWDDSISGWADITGATYGDDYTLSYLIGGDLDGYTVLTASIPAPAMVGDANRDGVVNAADAAVLATYWQTAFGALWGMGDFNGDKAVNDIDATLMAANWGNSTNAAVPEPSTLVGLMGLCLAGLLASAHRKRCCSHPATQPRITPWRAR